ncbi:hypothetical protein HPB50_026022 [Hyalomma asiaticum]|uniref:Uncharacterized protein n=1 Tax=Hyalomma asiaticum TaxID=266040 RepID=A0ACB7TNG8_HYAAI|nr:hypothetical protein HPB50_026022 [Hyalomma asiaticum]
MVMSRVTYRRRELYALASDNHHTIYVRRHGSINLTECVSAVRSNLAGGSSSSSRELVFTDGDVTRLEVKRPFSRIHRKPSTGPGLSNYSTQDPFRKTPTLDGQAHARATVAPAARKHPRVCFVSRGGGRRPVFLPPLWSRERDPLSLGRRVRAGGASVGAARGEALVAATVLLREAPKSGAVRMRGESSGRAGGGWWSDQADGQARKACRPNTTGEHRRSAPKAVSRLVHGKAGHDSWQACHDTASDVLPVTHVATPLVRARHK